VNAANVGLIPQGAMVERDTSVDLSGFKTVSLLLRNPDFTTATEIADAVNHEYGRPVATALDNSRVDIDVAQASTQSVSTLISRVQNLVLNVHTPAKIIINERTGTIVMGGDVKLSPVSVIHGNLSIQVITAYNVAGVAPISPTPGAPGDKRKGEAPEQVQPIVVPETHVETDDETAQTMKLDEGANVDQLVNGLHAIGTTAHDVVAILQAIRAEGGMQAELEVQ
jgi:flagellar P-ring protein precursor FlgI